MGPVISDYFSRYPTLNEWDMKISFVGSSGIWNHIPWGRSPSGIWFQIPLLPKKDIFIFHELRVGYLHYPTIKSFGYRYCEVYFHVGIVENSFFSIHFWRVGYKILGSISGEWSMVSNTTATHIGSIFKCDIWDLVRMEYEAESWVMK